jgi:hypothetical protein
LLGAINDFLDESVVLPPGDWDSKNMLSMSEIQELRNRKKKGKAETPVDEITERPGGNFVRTDNYMTDPLIRAPYIFGGVINDIKRRFKWYLSDFLDGFNTQCLAAAIFIYFANLSGAVAFGGLLGTFVTCFEIIAAALIRSWYFQVKRLTTLSVFRKHWC